MSKNCAVQKLVLISLISFHLFLQKPQEISDIYKSNTYLYLHPPISMHHIVSFTALATVETVLVTNLLIYMVTDIEFPKRLGLWHSI